jgi:DNA-binding transcriptional ArsR family regulator
MPGLGWSGQNPREEKSVSGKAMTSEPALDPQTIKAIGHPIRLDALRVLGEEVASPTQVARKIHQSVGKVSHHVRVLRDCGFVELVDTRQVRGATEHFYRATERANVTDEISELLPQEIREKITDKMLIAIIDRIGAAVKAGTIDLREDRHISWMPLNLDEQGWSELIELKKAQLDAEIEIEAQATGRLAKSGEEAISVLSATLGIEAAPR